MSRKYLALSRLLVLFLLIVVASNGTSSSITNTPTCTQSYQIYTEGVGNFTDGFAPSTTIEYGKRSYSGEFWSWTDGVPYDGETKLRTQPDIYGFDYDSKKNPWSGVKGEETLIRSILYEMQMGPKKAMAKNQASITPS